MRVAVAELVIRFGTYSHELPRDFVGEFETECVCSGVRVRFPLSLIERLYRVDVAGAVDSAGFAVDAV